jgi:hypothetical protein
MASMIGFSRSRFRDHGARFGGQIACVISLDVDPRVIQSPVSIARPHAVHFMPTSTCAARFVPS